MLNNQNKITAFQLAMLTVAYMASVRVLPIMAEYGFSCLFYFFLAGLLFLVPTALISAELATAFPQRGGVYIWVKEAFGSKWGFLAIWMQFLSNLIVLPLFLSFIGATFAYIFMPQLAGEKWFLILFILAAVWGATFLSYFGMRFAGWINTFGAIFAVFIPVIVIVVLGIIWLFLGYKSSIAFSLHAFFPNFHHMPLRNLVFFAGILFSITGMEASGAHVLDVKDMQKNYPRGIIMAIFLVAFVSFGAVSIAVVVPQAHLSLVAGLMQAFAAFFTKFHLQWLVPVIAFCIVVGALAGINSNIIGPSKGLFGAAQYGEIPPFLTKVNKHGMPMIMFIFQGCLVTGLTMLMLLLPSINSSYWLMAVIVTIVYLCMYILLFLSAIVLRYKKPHINRPYKVPGGIFGMWVLVLAGMAVTLFGLVFAFLPPPGIKTANIFEFEIILVLGVIILIGLGFIIDYLKRPEWRTEDGGSDVYRNENLH